MLVAIFLGLLTLLVLVAAFFASKRWHWAHVLTSVLLYFATVGYLILMAQEQSARHQHQKAEHQALQQLERQTAQNDALATGTKSGALINQLRGQVQIDDDANEIGGIRELRHRVRMLNRHRGRVWRGAMPDSVDQSTGNTRVRFPVATADGAPQGAAPTEAAEPSAPAPLALATGSVVYVFEQGPAAGVEKPRRYVGEFRVGEVTGREALFEPLEHLPLDEIAGQRLIDSVGPWIVYESMPADDLDLLAGFSEEQLRAILPDVAVEEFLRDGSPSQDDDDPARLEGLNADGEPVAPGEQPVKYRYRRMPRDYAFLFHDLDKEYAELVALLQSAASDGEKLEGALEEARVIQGFQQDQSQKLQSDLTLVRRDLAVIEEYAKQLESQVAKAERLLDRVLRENARMVADLTRAEGDLAPIATGALDIDAL